MANQAEKCRVDSNRRRLYFFRIAILFANIWYGVIRLLLQSRTVFWFNIVAFLIANAVYLGCYFFLAGAAKTTYSAYLNTVCPGVDLSMGGVVEYVNDGIIFTVIVQILGGITDWAWILLLVPPAIALYVGWSFLSSLSASQKKQMEHMGGAEAKGQRRRAQKRRR